MNDDELARLRKKASHALAQAAYHIEATEPARLIASKKFVELILQHERMIHSKQLFLPIHFLKK